MPKSFTVIPSARRLMDSLRDIGYELPAAVADLVDNSVDADATQVDITVEFEGADSWVRIADNGTGMRTDRMNEAMRYGTERDYGEPDLGKFGLGLKTASLSQCRRLTVATRTNPARRSIEIRCWDLDHVIEEDSWDLLRLTTPEVDPYVYEPLDEMIGTSVVWERLDRVLAYRLPDGAHAQNGVSALGREIEDHLSMVFHRFLAGEARRTLPLTITVNGNPIRAWDPFSRKEKDTQKLARQSLMLHHAGAEHRVQVQPYILPNQMQFSTATAWEQAGQKNWNRMQGLYIYRGDRLIQAGGWNRLRTSDEHTKLARIAIDVPRSADTAFEINVSKMRVTIPSDIRSDLKAIASAVANQAKRIYNRSGGTSKRPTAPRRRGSPEEEWGWGNTPEPAGGLSTRNGVTGRWVDADSDDYVSLSLVADVIHRVLAKHPSLAAEVLTELGKTTSRTGARHAHH